MPRFDDVGLFWEDPRKERTRKGDAPRVLPPVPETGWRLPESGLDLYPDLRNQGMISIDVEANDPNLTNSGPGHVKGTAYICGVAVGTEAGFRQYYPIAHEPGGNLPKAQVYKWLNVQLNRPNQPKVGAKLLYDLEALTCAGVKVTGPFYDVQVSEPLLDETRLSYALEDIAMARLGEGKEQSIMLDWLRRAFGSKETNIKKHIWRAPPKIVGPYAESDIDLPLRLFAVHKPLLEAEGLWDLFLMESRLIPMLLAMRLRGVPVDVSHAETLLSELGTGLTDKIDEIKRLTGIRPDIWAADSLAKIFDKEGIEYPRTAKTKQPSFRKDWLNNHTHPVAKMIADARHLEKFKSTFVEGYILNGNVNGRIFCEFNQLRGENGGTVSGRFSSSNPNLQNIPTRTEMGTRIRQAFIPEDGQSWWKFDWSQIEYRLIVHYAKRTNKPGIDPIVQRYHEDRGVDYHQAVADLTGLTRSNAKNLNFGLAYGQGIDLLCENLGVDRPTGEAIMAEYHKRAPFIRPLADMVSERARDQGFITTLMGRRRRFNTWERIKNKKPEYVDEDTLRSNSEWRWRNALKEGGDVEFDIREFDEQQFRRMARSRGWRRAFLHKALNALIQGSAADVMKKAMVMIWESGLCNVLGAPHLTVHDELDGSFEARNHMHQEALREVQNIMETCTELAVPLLADGGTGDNWGALE